MNLRTRGLAPLALLLCLAAGPASAAQTFDTVAEALAAARAGQVRLDRVVTIRKVTVVTNPKRSPDDDSYDDYFYVNDEGRDGDGILFSYPTYWASGSDPFDEDSEDPFEDSIEVPAFKRGWEISVSGYLDERDDGRGWMLQRRVDYWSYDDEFHDLVVEHEGTDDETHTIRAVFTVHSKTEAPAPSAKPSRVRVYPGKVVRPGQLIVVAARDVGVRGRLRWDYKDMDTGFDRRPGLLMARIPANATPGDHRLQVRNPETGNSRSVKIRVIAPPAPPAPVLSEAKRVGELLIIEGQNLSGGSLEVELGSLKLRAISRDAGTIVASWPASVSASTTRKVRVSVGGRASNQVAIASHEASVGIAGSLPGN